MYQGWSAGNSVIAPADLMRPMRPTLTENQPLTSGPAVPEPGLLPALVRGNSVISPATVARPILFAPASENQRFPSGADVMVVGAAPDEGTGNSVISPAGVTRPILLPSYSVNQTLPSAPPATAHGRLFAVGMANSTTLNSSVRPTAISSRGASTASRSTVSAGASTAGRSTPGKSRPASRAPSTAPCFEAQPVTRQRTVAHRSRTMGRLYPLDSVHASYRRDSGRPKGPFFEDGARFAQGGDMPFTTIASARRHAASSAP